MSFKILPNNQGMIYEPDCKPGQRKHPCPDCFSCQWCGNERCRICRAVVVKKRKNIKKYPARGHKCLKFKVWCFF